MSALSRLGQGEAGQEACTACEYTYTGDKDGCVCAYDMAIVMGI